VPGAKHFVDLEGKTTIAGVKMTAAKIMSGNSRMTCCLFETSPSYSLAFSMAEGDFVGFASLATG
jgi:hypothetical protein